MRHIARVHIACQRLRCNCRRHDTYYHMTYTFCVPTADPLQWQKVTKSTLTSRNDYNSTFEGGVVKVLHLGEVPGLSPKNAEPAFVRTRPPPLL